LRFAAERPQQVFVLVPVNVCFQDAIPVSGTAAQGPAYKSLAPDIGIVDGPFEYFEGGRNQAAASVHDANDGGAPVKR
jgi:hypothetical protein